MNLLTDKSLLPNFESILCDDEEIIWIGNPKFIPFIISDFLSTSLLIAVAIFISFSDIEPPENDLNDIWNFFLIIGLLLILKNIYSLLDKLFSFKNTIYAFTSKRLMVRTGYIQTYFNSINFDKITEIGVTAGFFERVFNVGTINFYTGKFEINEDKNTKVFESWCAISNPYEIFKMVKQKAD